MRRRHLARACLLLAGLAGACDRGAAAGAPVAPAPGPEVPPGRAGEHGPVVLELFTSQGCSSCPPADRLLVDLAAETSAPARVALAYHVDYWDDLGWADPLAAPAWSTRQRAYARSLGTRGPYTPQLVIDGVADRVGSDRAGIVALLAQVDPPAPLRADATWSADAVELTATAPADAPVLAALWADAAATPVEHGENRGETLVNPRVVRALVEVAPAGQVGRYRLHRDPAWTHVGVVVFAQREHDGAIIASRDLPAPR
ncbi:MAG: DUF1223 domain-containing protein [Kofleriaceae bacterium]|jgi:hypothetical protein|nr:DUF1223 domain-containing protein [Kofleriaceae bacterium]MBP6838756.1 DUF1223 domain-containing protein [Kofleriaceae bacterium]